MDDMSQSPQPSSQQSESSRSGLSREVPNTVVAGINGPPEPFVVPTLFFHGTRADLGHGELLEPGRRSNFGSGRDANHVYVTSTLDAAIWGAELSAGDAPGRIYIVEPTGPIENDPNLTDTRYPGNPTKSYRSKHPVRVIGEIWQWHGHDDETLNAMRENIARLAAQGVEADD